MPMKQTTSSGERLICLRASGALLVVAYLGRSIALFHACYELY